VVFVDHHRIEPDLVGDHEFRKVALIERVALFGIVIFVRKIDPGRFVVLMVLGKMHIRHEVHEIETDGAVHRDLPWRRRDRAA
jgi:hypothetical protein